MKLSKPCEKQAQLGSRGPPYLIMCEALNSVPSNGEEKGKEGRRINLDTLDGGWNDYISEQGSQG